MSGPLRKTLIEKEPMVILGLAAELKKQSIPSIEIPLELELKQLLAYLQYAYLESG